VVGLGPAGPDQLTVAAVAAIDRVPPGRRFLRTVRHPAAVALGEGVASFDRMYDRAATLDEVYPAIVEALVGAASGSEVLYAVPGSPLVAERTVELLLADPRVTVEVVPGMSFADLAWARVGIDPVAAGARLVDGHRFAVEAAGERGPMLVAQCDSKKVLSDIKLSVEESAGLSAVVLSRLGLTDESVRTVAWDDLDRDVEPDHLTSVFIPVLAAPVAGEVARFAELVRTLRERCPWDREQTHATLTRHLLEETYEVLEAIGALDVEAGEGFEHLEEELGDLLFQVVFHATLAAEEGHFTLADVARGIHDKLVHRHPHVFGDVAAATTGEVVRNWERIKQAEKGRSSMMDGIAADLPSLLYAHKVQRKAHSVGLDPMEGGPGAGSLPAVTDLQAAGELLFEAVDRIRRGGLDPEAALRSVTARFRDRFMAAERAAAEGGSDLGRLDPATVTGLWQFAKPSGGE
jgi:tetrapyrrole methylase family protein/MazG family protein